MAQKTKNYTIVPALLGKKTAAQVLRKLLSATKKQGWQIFSPDLAQIVADESLRARVTMTQHHHYCLSQPCVDLGGEDTTLASPVHLRWREAEEIADEQVGGCRAWTRSFVPCLVTKQLCLAVFSRNELRMAVSRSSVARLCGD